MAVRKRVRITGHGRVGRPGRPMQVRMVPMTATILKETRRGRLGVLAQKACRSREDSVEKIEK